MRKMTVGEAVTAVRRDTHDHPVRVEDWARMEVNDNEVFVLAYSYMMHYRPEDDLKPKRMYRLQVFINGSWRSGLMLDG